MIHSLFSLIFRVKSSGGTNARTSDDFVVLGPVGQQSMNALLKSDSPRPAADELPFSTCWTSSSTTMSFQSEEFVSPLDSLVFDTYLDTTQSDREAAEELALWVRTLFVRLLSKLCFISKRTVIILE